MKMKVFNKSYLPTEISYNGKEFVCDFTQSALIHSEQEAKRKGVKVIVNILSNSLKGRTDLHGNPYKASVFIFKEK